ncbi:fumarylacetoacetase [Streptomyces afghaniensis]|uniref:fumarylacetoacetase n=1 Tax=Streptomyces afghaniensis TaxID=66865 RepID=UPI0033BEDC92
MTWWPQTAHDGPYGLANLPYGVFSRPGHQPRAGVRVGDHVLDLAPALDEKLFDQPTLNPYLALGHKVWHATRARIQDLLTDERQAARVRPLLAPLDEVRLHLPFAVGDYVDFYASKHHAANLGRIFRPATEPLTANWKHLPIGYHGRSGTVVVSGTPVVRPGGQRKAPEALAPSFGPSQRLDIEAEVGFVIGPGTDLGSPIKVEDFTDHVFGVSLVNDWSARDLQSWEYVPLGPFLGKSFATSVSPWIVPLEALTHAWCEPPRRTTPLLPYLQDVGKQGLNLDLEVALNGHVVSRPPYAEMYWTPAQMLAHMTANGASVRPGDLYASGTVSGPHPDQYGSLIELTAGGSRPLQLPDGTTRTYLQDSDEVTISGQAPGPAGTVIGLGTVSGTIAATPPGLV